MSPLEIAILVFYGLLMTILSVYSLHAYLMVYLYRKHRGRTAKPKRSYRVWPRVTVQLPIYNEKYVVERLIEAACAIDYPRDRLEIQVLDDSTDETRELAGKIVLRHQLLGVDIVHLHRRNRAGFKAGALREGLKSAKGRFIAIFDADFLPPPDFLKMMLPYFAGREVGLVQARWGHLNGDSSLLTRGQTIGLDAHFVIEHEARNAEGIFINFNGTAGIWRRRAIEDAGNWQDDTLTEDMDLSYRAQLAGWRFVYVNEVVCPAEVPAEIHGYKAQQYRWAKGAIQTAKKLLPRIWRAPGLPPKVKWEATIHLTNHLVFPVMLLVALLSLPMMVIKVSSSASRGFFIGATVFTASAFSYPLFYIYAQREIYPDWKRRVLFLPILMAGAIGLSVTNTKAVLGALFNRRSAFIRTPKYDLRGRARSRFRVGAGYRAAFSSTVLLELLLFAYVSYALWYSVRHLQLATVPFVLIYWMGFLFIGSLSLFQGLRR
ncbi:MAG TPA: glycosyl transferase family 2 [candidate division Zixibacteria bacterium]|jgi:cellulose synthase/poly-beta-1,6-N-acetylglucosamine synthase-like glycosyltransferase|nr:glycosyl transferase family 2 [candidate division Zixibacteria bacterium]